MALRIPPLLVAAIAAGLMWTVARALPDLRWFIPRRELWAAAIAVCGVALCAAGVWHFRRSGTTVNPMRPDAATTLVVDGVYRWTRNPMYLGFALALIAWGVVLGSPIAVMGVVAFWAYMNRFQIEPEERALSARFGAQFDEYRRRVRRWF